MPVYNFQKDADNEGKHVCEALSTDKYNNSEDFHPSEGFDHFSIAVSPPKLTRKQNFKSVKETAALFSSEMCF